jgi:hypothetical protein
MSGNTSDVPPGAAAIAALTLAATDDPRVTVYRVVDATELSFLAAEGNYGSSPSQSGKYFTLTLAGARAFASAPMNVQTTITSTTLPQSVLADGRLFFDPGVRGAGRSVFFSQPQLPTVYGAMTPPKILLESHGP